MPVPKKRHSNTRTNRRRKANFRVKPVNFASCPACGEPILPHRACTSCGAYQGRQVITLKEKKDKKKEK